MELRRAILLFAIVLGLAAVATAVSRPAQETEGGAPAEPKRSGAPSTPTARSRPDAPRVEIRFETGAGADLRTLPAGRSATVTVHSARPGLVALGDSGLNAPAERLTPARFDVLFAAPARYEVMFTPVGAEKARKVGVLKVEG